MKILKDYQPHTMPFLNDITTRGPKTNYGGKEAQLGMRRFILEHIMQLDRVLADIKRANRIVSRKKCHQGIDRLVVVRYKVSTNRRYPNY